MSDQEQRNHGAEENTEESNARETWDQDTMLQHIRYRLDLGVARIDGQTRERLDAMRHQALARPRELEALNDSEENLVNAATVSLDDSVAALDPIIVARLEQARNSALDQNRHSQESPPLFATLRTRVAGLFSRHRFAVPAGAVATVCVLVAALSLSYQLPEWSGQGGAEADVLLFADNDELELYDNLEFYLWLADNGLSN